MNPVSAPLVGEPASLPALAAPSLPRRMACWLYEGMLLFAVVFVAAWLFSTLSQMRNGMDERRHLLQAFLFVVFGIYFGWFWARGQTLAMKTWRIRIVTAQGLAVSQPRACLRYVLSWVWFLPSAAAAHALSLSGGETITVMAGWVAVWAILARFQREKQFWHDIWAGTRLTDAPAPPPRPKRR